jgi:hypothetical protein
MDLLGLSETSDSGVDRRDESALTSSEERSVIGER